MSFPQFNFPQFRFHLLILQTYLYLLAVPSLSWPQTECFSLFYCSCLLKDLLCSPTPLWQTWFSDKLLFWLHILTFSLPPAGSGFGAEAFLNARKYFHEWNIWVNDFPVCFDLTQWRNLQVPVQDILFEQIKVMIWLCLGVSITKKTLN